jgi:hypothetical protein
MSGITRPKLSQINTAVIAFRDPITVIHAGATSADVDIGFLMNRANGLLANVAIYWSESGNTFVTAFTSNSGATDSNIVPNSYANFTTGNIYARKIYTNDGLYWAGNGDVIVTGGGGGSTYSNVNVEAYIGGNISSINANITAANSAIQTLSANIGTLVAGAPAALDTLSELSNALGNSSSFSSTMVNWLGNITSNITAANTSINSFNANLGAYQTYANANIGVLFNGNASTNANLGAYQTWANTNFGTSTYSNTNVEAYIGGNIGAYQTYANTTVAAIQANLGAYQTYANADSYFTASTTQPTTPEPGDQWYNTTTDILYEFIANYWVDIQSPSVTSNGVSSYGNPQVASYLSTYSGSIGGPLTVGANVTVTGNILPSANITYDLGSDTQRWRDLYLSGSTINLGGATIKTDVVTGAIALIPQPTVANPNPKGIVVSPAGTVSAVSTTGGILTTTAISDSSNTATTTNTTTFGNLTSNGNIITSNVYADRFFYSNGTAFSSSNYGNTEVAAYLVANPFQIAGTTGSPGSAAVTNGDIWFMTGTYGVEIEVGENFNSKYANISTPQDLQTTASPSFTGLTVNSTNIEANLGTATTNITTLFSNAATQAITLNTINSNVTAANASISTVNANIGAYQTYANANVATLQANLGTIYLGNVSTNSNLGAFQTYANLHFSDTSFGNGNVTSYLTSSTSGLVSVTSSLQMPAGTTAERPATTANGAIRYNTTLGRIEAYMYASGWVGIVSDSLTIEFLIIAGGGGGGGAVRGGGGGAGGYISSVQGEMSGGGVAAISTQILNAGSYPIIVGSGGAAGAYGTSNEASAGTIGQNSSAFSLTAIGGGGGGASDSSGAGRSATSGGSGGGGWYQQGAGGNGTTGQGYAGGTSGTPYPYGGGGGGAGQTGRAYNDATNPCKGGQGVQSNITGTLTYRAGGGSSAGYPGQGAVENIAGGLGGGGTGMNNFSRTSGQDPANGTAYTGGGGGASGNGGDGVVIIRYLGSQRATGGTVSSSGGYTIHTFTGSGSFIV